MTENAGLSSIEAYDDLREAVGEPTASIAEKEMPMLDKHARHFLSLSPILFISTVGVDGRADISPRGDPAGFVKVIDDRTILIPERPGNRRVDTMSNIVENPGHSVALIFLLPGVEETLRASGRARIVDDRVALEDMAVAARSRSWGFWSRSTRCSFTAPRRSSAPGCGIPIRGSNERNFRRSPRSPGTSGNTTLRWKRSRKGFGRATRRGCIDPFRRRPFDTLPPAATQGEELLFSLLPSSRVGAERRIEGRFPVSLGPTESPATAVPASPASRYR